MNKVRKEANLAKHAWHGEADSAAGLAVETYLLTPRASDDGAMDTDEVDENLIDLSAETVEEGPDIENHLSEHVAHMALSQDAREA